MRLSYISVIGFILIACSSGGMSITGELQRQSARTDVSYQLLNSADIDAIWALPTFGAALGTFSFEEKIVVPVASDGSFQFDVPENASYDYVLALVDTSKCSSGKDRADWTEADIDERFGCIQGYVSVADAADSEAMVAIPTSRQDSDVKLGRLQTSGVEAKSMDTNLEELSGSYSIDLDSLKAIARVDNMLLGLAYLYANQDDTFSLFYRQNLDYRWFAASALSAARDQFTDGSALEYSASTYYFETNVNTGDIVSSIQSMAGYLGITPPGDIVLERDGATYGPGAPIESTTPGTADGSGWYDDRMGFNLEQGRVFGSIGSFEGFPAGPWLFSRAGEVVSKFDLSLSAPFDVVDGQVDQSAPVVFVPQIKINTQSDAVVDIEIVYSIWNGSSFVEVPFDTAWRTLASTDIALVGDGGAGCPADWETGQAGSGDNNVAIEADRLRFTPTGAWTFGSGDASTCTLTGVTIGLWISANSFQFHWSADEQYR